MKDNNKQIAGESTVQTYISVVARSIWTRLDFRLQTMATWERRGAGFFTYYCELQYKSYFTWQALEYWMTEYYTVQYRQLVRKILLFNRVCLMLSRDKTILYNYNISWFHKKHDLENELEIV